MQKLVTDVHLVCLDVESSFSWNDSKRIIASYPAACRYATKDGASKACQSGKNGKDDDSPEEAHDRFKCVATIN